MSPLHLSLVRVCARVVGCRVYVRVSMTAHISQAQSLAQLAGNRPTSSRSPSCRHSLGSGACCVLTRLLCHTALRSLASTSANNGTTRLAELVATEHLAHSFNCFMTCVCEMCLVTCVCVI
jgi:hypothetical protein